MSEQFTFVDSTALVSKLTLWEERDKAIQAGYEKLNNEVLPEVSHDKEARIGSKGKNKFWYGYKSHTAVDMNSGMISAVNVTPANVDDPEGSRSILPTQGYVFGDKGYVGMIEDVILRGAIPRIILRNKMLEKDSGRDREISRRRSPFERVFSKRNKRVRYAGTAKNQFAEYLVAIAFNLRRLIVISPI